MGRVGLINSGGARARHDFGGAVTTAVINKRAGGMGLISGRKAFQRPMKEGVELLQHHPGSIPVQRGHRGRNVMRARVVNWYAGGRRTRPMTRWRCLIACTMRASDSKSLLLSGTVPRRSPGNDALRPSSGESRRRRPNWRWRRSIRSTCERRWLSDRGQR